jgi:hypothetical protein
MDYFDFAQAEFLDPADWSLASYSHHPIDDLEPLPDHSSSYRDAALECLGILKSADAFVSQARDTRFAWVVVALVLGLDSVAGMSHAKIARQLSISELCLRRAVARFTKFANLDSFVGSDSFNSNGSTLSGNAYVKLRIDEFSFRLTMGPNFLRSTSSSLRRHS